jgi:CBS domain-containing protein
MLRAMEQADLPEEPESTHGKKSFEARLLGEPIGSLSIAPALTVPLDAPLKKAVEIMQNEHIGCVLVVDGAGVLKGIFTERDLLSRVAGRGLDWSACKVADYMTSDPESLRADDRIVWALNLMHVGGYRHVPITDVQGHATGVVSVKDIVAFIVDLFPDEVLNLPPDPHRPVSSDDVGGGTD